MIRILLEGRDAPLYHCTTLSGLISILIDDKLEPSIVADASRESYKAVCFTRDKHYKVHKDSIMQLQFNQARLVSNYKVIPVAEAGFSGKSSEKEERVITNRPLPVSKYLVAIDITGGEESAFLKELLDAIEDPFSSRASLIRALINWCNDDVYPFGPRIKKLFDKYGEQVLNAEDEAD